MDNLDNLAAIKELDKNHYLDSVEALEEQCRQTWQEVSEVTVPADYRSIEKIVINGMGGSSFGGLVVKSVFSDRLKVPLEVINSYTAPFFVDEKTLFIFASYSGSTEEVLATTDEALRRGAKCLGITSGGKLAEILSTKQIPYFQIRPQFNPSGQPRAGLGYAILGVAGLLRQTGLLSLSEEEIQKVFKTLNQTKQLFGVSVPEKENQAKELAGAFQEKIAILVGAEFLAGSTHIFRNQLHETAKNFADFFLLSEMNHHLLEALANPQANKENLCFLFLKSPLYHPLIQKRLEITKDVVLQNKVPVLEYACQAEDKLAGAFEVIHLGSYTSFYLAMLNGVDPSQIPWVDYFKEKLKD